MIGRNRLTAIARAGIARARIALPRHATVPASAPARRA
jgi:hypothetical protein